MNNIINSSGKKNWYKILLVVDLVILLISIIIPFYLIWLNHQLNGCFYHLPMSRGRRSNLSILWIFGRALGFSTLIWFIFSSFQGFTTNFHAKLFNGKKKAQDFHCIGAFITSMVLAFHILFLIISEPWYSVIFKSNIAHFPYLTFAIKIWTGIIFAIIMISVSILSFYLRDIQKLKKFGYKNFILIHRIMLIYAIMLVIHIFLINTELLILNGIIDN